MSKIGRFDTDTAALQARNAAHRRYSTGDMTGWALNLLGARPDDRVLELGAGTGQQTLRLAPDVRSVLAIDASADSLATIDAAGRDNVTTRAARFDELLAESWDEHFDRALACYALYYADDQRGLLAHIADGLQPGGTLFFCGPSKANNRELRELHFGLLEQPIPGATPAQRFMEDDAPGWCEELFAGVERFAFTDEMRFDSAEALVGYWSAYNLYDPRIDDAFRAAAEQHFADQDVFVSAKRVVGIRAVKG